MPVKHLVALAIIATCGILCGSNLSYVVEKNSDPRKINRIITETTQSKPQPAAVSVIPKNQPARTETAKQLSWLKPTPENPPVIKEEQSGQKTVIVSIASQRLYAWENNRLRWTMICSTAPRSLSVPSGVELTGIHNHIGQFTILAKEKNKFSRAYNTPMPYALKFYGGHYIHATTEISRLGIPVSHGCVRLHPKDASKLFGWATEGDSVIVTLD